MLDGCGLDFILAWQEWGKNLVLSRAVLYIYQALFALKLTKNHPYIS